MYIRPISQQYSNKTKQNTSFGTIINVKKVLVNGEESKDIAIINHAAKLLRAIMFKQIEHEQGNVIRECIQKMAPDYKIPAGSDLKFIPAEIALSKKGEAYLFIGKHYQKLTSKINTLKTSFNKTDININQYENLLKQRIGQMIEGNSQKNNEYLSINLLKTDDNFAIEKVQFV